MIGISMRCSVLYIAVRQKNALLTIFHACCISYNLGISYLYNSEGLVASDAGERRTTVFNLQIRGGH